MFDRKNDVARNKKRADAIVYAGAADEVVLTQSDFESEEEFRRWKAWSDADYKQTEKTMRRDYDHVIYGLEGWKIPASERMEKQEEIIKVPSSIMRKFIYKSGRTQSAQGRETCP